jgi:acyl-CoA hydrolase
MTIELHPDSLDLSKIIRAGDTIFVSQGTAEPQTLTETLVRQRAAVGRVSVFLGPAFSQTWQPEHADFISFVSYGALGTNGRLSKAGVLDVFPGHVSQLPGLLAAGSVPCDVVFIQLSAPNAEGKYSFGNAHDYLVDAARRARVVIAEVNDQAPWTYGGAEALAKLRIDYRVRTSRPLLELKPAVVGETERRIAAYAAPYIGDGAALETGIGAIPDAILSALRDRRDLGIHTGLMGDSLVELVEAGVITNARKTIDRGLCTSGVLFGTPRLYRFAHNNPQICLQPVTHTHNVEVMGRLDNFIAINSAIEVDLTGQVNAEMAGNDYIGAVGGQVDFVRGAWQSRGGRSIIALPATAKQNTISRVVARINSGVVTTPRSDADLIVTEWGAAELRGQTLAERARRMIAIAHPDFREQLEREAHTLLRQR